MSGDEDQKSGHGTPRATPKTPGSGDDRRDAETPRPRHPFIPGPVISEPDEVVKVWTPLPPEKKK